MRYVKKVIGRFFEFLFIPEKRSEVFYIQGGDVLPKPLEKEEEQKAFDCA